MSSVDAGAIHVGRRVYCWIDTKHDGIKAGDLVRYVDGGVRHHVVAEVRGERVKVKLHKHEARKFRWFDRARILAVYRWRKELAA